MSQPKRKGARRRADVDAATKAALEAGSLAAASLSEALVVDFRPLLRTVAPEVPEDQLHRVAPEVPYLRRMTAAANLLGRHVVDTARFAALQEHASDTVRGWACHVLLARHASDARLLKAIRPLADDEHFAVREWAWLAVRPRVAADVAGWLARLAPWTGRRSANLRRFAVEVTRPRGVWCGHLPALKEDPSPGLVLLEPLRADGSKYVQDSVANWLNDAAKTTPTWVTDVTDRWLAESDLAQTRRIVRRGRRSL